VGCRRENVCGLLLLAAQSACRVARALICRFDQLAGRFVAAMGFSVLPGLLPPLDFDGQHPVIEIRAVFSGIM
jgi:hypothetical protein